MKLREYLKNVDDLKKLDAKVRKVYKYRLKKYVKNCILDVSSAIASEEFIDYESLELLKESAVDICKLVSKVEGSGMTIKLITNIMLKTGTFDYFAKYFSQSSSEQL